MNSKAYAMQKKLEASIKEQLREILPTRAYFSNEY